MTSLCHVRNSVQLGSCDWVLYLTEIILKKMQFNQMKYKKSTGVNRNVLLAIILKSITLDT